MIHDSRLGHFQAANYRATEYAGHLSKTGSLEPIPHQGQWGQIFILDFGVISAMSKGTSYNLPVKRENQKFLSS
jgi:hypothetical protein